MLWRCVEKWQLHEYKFLATTESAKTCSSRITMYFVGGQVLWPVGVVVKDIAIGAGGLGFASLAGQIRRSVANGSLPLRGFPGAEPRRWTPPLVTHFVAIPRV